MSPPASVAFAAFAAPRTLGLGIALIVAACGAKSAPEAPVAANSDLAGVWRAKVTFNDGALAALDDLEFLYSFNPGGTLTESSNYDGAPPVPPAYGVWRKTGPNRFAARYEFFTTTPPEQFREIAGGGGWKPAGRGVLEEAISLAGDGKSYRSTVTLALFDAAGKPVSGGGEGKATATRLGF